MSLSFCDSFIPFFHAGASVSLAQRYNPIQDCATGHPGLLRWLIFGEKIPEEGINLMGAFSPSNGLSQSYGNHAPSRQVREYMNRIAEAGMILGIRILDHIMRRMRLLQLRRCRSHQSSSGPVLKTVFQS
jgi:hypothetical protein